MVEGPFGNLTLHNNSARAAVFVSGGIGITPVRSILFSAAQKTLPHRIFLFFSNRTRQDAPFFDELTVSRPGTQTTGRSYDDRLDSVIQQLEWRNRLYQQRDAGEASSECPTGDLLPDRTIIHGCGNANCAP